MPGAAKRAAVIRADCCTGCSQCKLVCPCGALRQQGIRYVVDVGTCSGCGRCRYACPNDCVRLQASEGPHA